MTEAGKTPIQVDGSNSSTGSSEGRLALLERLSRSAVCAEIGVWRANFSQLILKVTRPNKLHLIDPWLFAPCFPMRWYGGKQAKSQDDMDEIYKRVADRFRNDNRVSIHRVPSLEAAESFDDERFDWVYIDGNHSYDEVLADLKVWARKVKRGGNLAGDDWHWRDEEGNLSVKLAVTRFASEMDIEVEVIPPGQYLLKI